MDSDKSYPCDDYGASAKSAMQAYNHNKNTYPLQLYILNVRAKENVIPPSILMWLGDLSRHQTLLTLARKESDELYWDLLRFINLKDGVTYKKVFEKYASYKDLFAVLGYDLSSVNSVDLDKCCIEGIGSNALNKFRIKILRHGYLDDFENAVRMHCSEDVCQRKKVMAERCNHLIEHMPSFLEREWSAITEQIITFGICFPETERFVS